MQTRNTILPKLLVIIVSTTMLSLFLGCPTADEDSTTTKVCPNNNNNNADAGTASRIYFLTDKTGKAAQTTLHYFGNYSSTLTNVTKVDCGGDGTTSYERFTRISADWGAGGWSNKTKEASKTIDLSTYNTLVFWARSSNTTVVKFGMEDADSDNPEISKTITSSWARYTISFADLKITDATKVKVVKYVLNAKDDIVDLDEIYVTNITDTKAPTVSSISATSNSKIVAITFSEPVTFTNTTTKSEKIKGITVKTGTSSSTQATTNTVTDAVVRTTDNNIIDLTLTDNLLNGQYIKVEFTAENTITDTATNKLAVATPTAVATIKVPTAVATAPNYPTANVISLYTSGNTHSDKPITYKSTDWNASTKETDYVVAAKTVKKFTNFDFFGYEITPTDISSMTHVSFDVWIPGDISNTANLKFKLVDYGLNNKHDGTTSTDDVEHELKYTATTTPALVKETWVTFNLPLTNFINLTTKNNLAQIIFATDGGITTFYLDNLLFHK